MLPCRFLRFLSMAPTRRNLACPALALLRLRPPQVVPFRLFSARQLRAKAARIWSLRTMLQILRKRLPLAPPPIRPFPWPRRLAARPLRLSLPVSLRNTRFNSHPAQVSLAWLGWVVVERLSAPCVRY